MKIFSEEMAPLTQEYFFKKAPISQKIIIWIIAILFLTVIFITCIAPFEEVIKSSGFIRPQENISSIDNAVTGRIEKVLYKNGQTVKQGEVLLKIDETQYLTQKESILSQIENEKTKLESLYEIKNSIEAGKNLISSENTECFYRFELWQSNLRKMKSAKDLAFSLFDMEKSLPSSITTKSHLKELETNFISAKEDYNNYDYSFRYNIAQEITELETSAKINEAKLRQIEDSILYTRVTAPIDGIIQELSVFNEGDWIQAGQNLFNIIPNNSQKLKIELQVSANQAGKIKQGMPVKMRFPSLPYNEFGGAEGKILIIDADMKNNQNGNPYFLIVCDINKQILTDKKGKKIPLKIGLQVDARIILDKKTIANFVLEKLNFLY